tara:strand:- start:17788 stop:18156 length:369 start_codon:yes stop_codon:yes gene_type:complete
MKESQIQTVILNWLTLQPKDQMFSWRMYTGPIVRGNPKTGKTFFTPNPCPGLPDIIVIIKGRFVGLEIKQLKGTQSLEQETFEKAIKKAGGFYFLIRSLDEAIKAIESIQQLTEIDCGRNTH